MSSAESSADSSTNWPPGGEPDRFAYSGGLRLLLGDVHAHGRKALAGSVAEALRRAVRGGQLPAGTALPASRSLAADLGVSRGVVVRAYEQLVAEGYLLSHTGRGTVVGAVNDGGGQAASVDRAMSPNPGMPALRWFPRRAWLRALESAMAEVSTKDLGYGDPRGHPRLRRALAAYLGRSRAVVAPPDQIVVTGGFAQAIRLVVEALTQHGITSIGVEDPGSIGVITTIQAAGATTRPIPVDSHGVDVSALDSSGMPAVVVTPAHQFPTGAVLSPARRAALREWATGRPGVVIEDDYDAEFRYDRAPVGALQGLAPARVVYGGSVSKTLAPALRLGWVVAPAWLAGTLADRKFLADIAAPVLDQLALAIFIETGAMDRHIRQVGRRYARCRARLLAATAAHLPEWKVGGVAAGVHAVLSPPPGLSLAELDLSGGVAGPVVTPLSAFTQVEPAQAGLVVGYGSATPDQVEHAIAGIAAHLRAGNPVGRGS